MVPTMETKYPHIEVQLTGNDGNAWAIVGKVREALRENGVPAARIKDFSDEAMSGDYDHLIRTCFFWVSVS